MQSALDAVSNLGRSLCLSRDTAEQAGFEAGPKISEKEGRRGDVLSRS
jgi:hypothetical protein